MPGRFNSARILFNLVSGMAILFIVVPIAVTIVVSFNADGFVLPPRALTLHWYEIALATREFTNGIVVSTVLGITAAVLANCVGFPLALAMTRREYPGKAAVNLLVMSPLLIPATILGLALFVTVSRAGFGSGLTTLVIGHTVLVLPFAVRTLVASLQNFDRSLEEACMNVGAGPLRTLIVITLPVIRTGLIASLILCFIISWNDFALSIFLAPSDWIPLPIQIYSYIKFQYDAAGAALVSFVVLLSFGFIVLLDRLVGLQAALGRGSEES